MERRRFDHLYVELSVALGELAPRYALWLRVAELGDKPELVGKPERRERDAAVSFCREELGTFLAEHDLHLATRPLRRLVRAVSRYDPEHPTPEEQLTGLFHRVMGER